ncbi:ANTAR domain-containing protein [Nocardioides sp. TF02-7]|uniref:ANTAR domain-containing protein n=1 Tax=Nocardioides sp. TF02-7 TaxID=2917724 RepID=UPI001F0602E1|nr:ANTAR domain-containing protein [Nocardioides sp. TF02-7]UMG91677.1 ANTAR domain-containing protein [Nocardioides sp. TF02-7]
MAPTTSSLLPLHERSRRRAMANRVVIEQAKGILILRYRIGPDHAFDVLRLWASETGHSLFAVAKTLVDAASGDPDAVTWDSALRARIELALDASSPPVGPRGPGPRLKSVR